MHNRVKEADAVRRRLRREEQCADVSLSKFDAIEDAVAGRCGE